MSIQHTHTLRKLRVALILGGVCVAVAVQAQNAGEVEFSRGVGFAQSPGQTPRTLGKGLPLQEGDRLTTSDGASAIIKLQDGTRMTVRPNTEMVLQQYQFKENADNNSMVMSLLRGGLRAVTGLISKSSPNAARIQTNTATIGIRGTDFDARLCAKDCGAEGAKTGETARPNAAQASARVVGAQGEISAIDSSGQRRRLVDGGSVYPGDLVETGPGTQALLAFRDESRISLGARARFRVDNFVFDEKNPNDGRFLVSLLRGSVRALTGLIGKANTRNVTYSTSTATIGIRGSYGQMCVGPCEPVSDEENPTGLTVYTFLGSFVVEQSGRTALDVLEAGQGIFISPTGIRALTTPPTGGAPDVNNYRVPPSLFSTNNISEDQEGLFVFVRDGHIEVTTSREVLQLGRGEAGFTDSNGNAARPSSIPRFLDFDTLPMPTSKNPLLTSILNESGTRRAGVCRGGT